MTIKILYGKTFCLLTIFLSVTHGYLEQGKWLYKISGNSQTDQSIVISKSLFNGSTIFVSIICKTSSADVMLEINWYLRKTACWKEYYETTPVGKGADIIFNALMEEGVRIANESAVFVTSSESHLCNDRLFYMNSAKKELVSSSDVRAEQLQKQGNKMAEMERTGIPKFSETNDKNGALEKKLKDSQSALLSKSGSVSMDPLFTVPADGIYQLILGASTPYASPNVSYTTTIRIEISSDYGYLSAADYPLLVFYSVMCVIYVAYGVAWLIVSFMRWRELLRVQYWIGAVILLGMLEKAVFTAEYESVNKTGESIPGLIIFAEFVSCAKRTLSRMLVIIVAFGYGIVKPRLGIVLQRVVGIGILYFILAMIEGCMRALRPTIPSDEYSRRLLFAIVPLALLESAICWWVFSSLVSTTRTLRLRRNTIKLELFQHFTNTLAFAVVSSVIFMLWSIRYRNIDSCLSDWKQLWVNDAFWHILFAILLLVIMVLWRPTNNNQRFAFSPLLDEGSEIEEEEREKLMANVSDTMKLRTTRNSSSSSRNSHSVEDDLRWLEENIPSSLTDTGLPVMDSDEEIITTKFEISKMQ